MTTNSIALNTEATRAIEALQSPAGTSSMYIETLNRISNYILHQSEEMGMSDTEAISTLRVLDMITLDIRAIAHPDEADDQPTAEETETETDPEVTENLTE